MEAVRDVASSLFQWAFPTSVRAHPSQSNVEGGPQRHEEDEEGEAGWISIFLDFVDKTALSF